MKALMQVRTYRAGGARRFPGEPSVSLTTTGRILGPMVYDAAGNSRQFSVCMA
jgi:hypothetical protein